MFWTGFFIGGFIGVVLASVTLVFFTTHNEDKDITQRKDNE